MSEPTHDDELAAFQAALVHLRPTPDGINVAQLMFRAGQLSARRSWAWPSAAAASMILAASLGFVLLFRPVPHPTERIVTVYVQPPALPTSQPEPPSPSTDTTPIPLYQPSIPEGESGYFQLRRRVLANGLDALPPPTPWPAVAPWDDAESLLDMPRGSREPWLKHLKRSLKSGDPL